MFPFELDFLKWLESFRTGFLNKLFQGITILGEETLIILLVVTLWFAVNRKLAQKVLFITISSLTVNGIVKNIAKVTDNACVVFFITTYSYSYCR